MQTRSIGVAVRLRGLDLLDRAIRPSRTASAHSGTHSYVYVFVGTAAADGHVAVTGNVQFPIADLNDVAGLDISQDETAALAAIARHRGELEGYTRAHFRIAGEAIIDFTGVRVLERKAGSYAILEYEVRSDPRFDPHDFVIFYDAIMHAKEHHEAIVIVQTSSGIGPFRAVREQRIDIRLGQTEQRITVPPSSRQGDFAGAGRFLLGESRELLRRARKRLRG